MTTIWMATAAAVTAVGATATTAAWSPSPRTARTTSWCPPRASCILDNYAFVRTTGYLPSENDVYVSLSMVRKWNLRRGDAVTGQVRQPREGERKEKFNPMVKIETVNGMSLEESAKRVEFSS